MAKKYETQDIFSKLHHHHQQQQQYQSQSTPHHPFHLSKESQTSEDDESTGPTPLPTQKPTLLSITSGGGDGASIEVSRKPRGRPPGSKNKPKPPLFITQDPEPAMSPYILEIPAGSDVVEALTKFSLRKNTGLCVLTGTGTVTNVTLRQPSNVAPAGTTVTFHGRFDILSISATVLPHASPPVQNGFSISLAGPQGQIVGGFVAGRLVAAGTVFVVAASFDNPSYHRLPLEEEVRNDNSVVSGGGEVQSPAVSGGGGEESAHAVTLYSCQLPSDVIWAPTAARPPPPPPPPY